MALNDYQNIRLSPSEKAELDQLARKTGRTRSNLIRALLLAALSDREYCLRLLGNQQPGQREERGE